MKISCPHCAPYPHIAKWPYLGEEVSGYRKCPQCEGYFSDDGKNLAVDNKGKPIKNPFNFAVAKTNDGDPSNPGNYISSNLQSWIEHAIKRFYIKLRETGQLPNHVIVVDEIKSMAERFDTSPQKIAKIWYRVRKKGYEFHDVHRPL